MVAARLDAAAIKQQKWHRKELALTFPSEGVVSDSDLHRQIVQKMKNQHERARSPMKKFKNADLEYKDFSIDSPKPAASRTQSPAKLLNYNRRSLRKQSARTSQQIQPAQKEQGGGRPDIKKLTLQAPRGT